MKKLLRQLKEEIQIINGQVGLLEEQKKEEKERNNKTVELLKGKEMKLKRTEMEFRDYEDGQKRLVESLKKEIKSLGEEVIYERSIKKEAEDSFK